jgi:hypothetical protein
MKRKTPLPSTEKLLTKEETARFLRIGIETLDRLHKQGIGPPRCKVGIQVRYRMSALLQHLDERTSTGGADGDRA